MKDNKEQLLTYVNSIVSTMAVLEAHDELKTTRFYNQMLRKRGDKFIEELERKMSPHLFEMYNKDEELSQELVRSYSRIGAVLGTVPPQDVIMIADQLEQYGKSKKQND